MRATETLANALKYAALGWPVFPCLDTKAPACPGGFKAASANPSAVRDLWRSHPGPLIGVATGSLSGFDVLDIDPRHGGDSWLDANRHRLPATREHQTRSGGLHILFRHRPGMRNTAGKIAPGIDTRGDGGYIIAWPAAGLPVTNPDLLADWPAWLAEELEPPPRPSAVEPPTIQGAGYAVAALRRAVEAVARAAPGKRNITLNREAFCLARFARSGDLDAQQIANALASASVSAGLDGPEIAATLASAFEASGLSE